MYSIDLLLNICQYISATIKPNNDILLHTWNCDVLHNALCHTWPSFLKHLENAFGKIYIYQSLQLFSSFEAKLEHFNIHSCFSLF